MLKFLLLFCYCLNLAVANCVLSLKDDFRRAQPLVLKVKNDATGSVLYPDERSIFQIARNNLIVIACPGSVLNINGQNFSQILPLVCTEGSYFQTKNGYTLNLLNISCKKSPAVQLENKGNEHNYNKIAVRFNFEPFGFHLPPQIAHYFDTRSKITAFTMYYIVATVKGQANCWQSSYFSEGGYYEDLSDRMNDIYKKNEQQKRINSLLSLPPTSNKYIHANSGELYLARGHLAATCDFVFEAQQKSTYYYVNVVPQWQSFNNGNWKKLESDLRNYATRNRLPLFIVAGTLGVLKLPHSRTQHPTELYLSTHALTGRKVVPVPKFMFKLAFDFSRARGAVFIGINNPYQREVEYICEDKSEQMRWLTWEKNNRIKGYSYACTIEDFRRIVRDLPFFDKATGGLLS